MVGGGKDGKEGASALHFAKEEASAEYLRIFKALEQRESECPLAFREKGERRFFGSGYLVEVISRVPAALAEHYA